MRFLFDKYIIKREFHDDNLDGKWSLKLRLMSALTVPGNGMTASQNWKEAACGQHELEMIEMLSRDCGLI